jgi:predicted nucleic acid-binding protein
MIVECFLDTNVLVYAAAGRGSDEWKRIRAFEILEPAEFGLSGQVLQEFYVTVTTKARVRLPQTEAAEWVERLSLRPVAPIDDAIVREAISLSVRYQISYWDAALIAAARSLDAGLLYTEDLNHGQSYADVQVVNPFRLS